MGRTCTRHAGTPRPSSRRRPDVAHRGSQPVDDERTEMPASWPEGTGRSRQALPQNWRCTRSSLRCRLWRIATRAVSGHTDRTMSDPSSGCSGERGDLVGERRRSSGRLVVRRQPAWPFPEEPGRWRHTPRHGCDSVDGRPDRIGPGGHANDGDLRAIRPALRNRGAGIGGPDDHDLEIRARRRQDLVDVPALHVDPRSTRRSASVVRSRRTPEAPSTVGAATVTAHLAAANSSTTSHTTQCEGFP